MFCRGANAPKHCRHSSSSRTRVFRGVDLGSFFSLSFSFACLLLVSSSAVLFALIFFSLVLGFLPHPFCSVFLVLPCSSWPLLFCKPRQGSTSNHKYIRTYIYDNFVLSESPQVVSCFTFVFYTYCYSKHEYSVRVNLILCYG